MCRYHTYDIYILSIIEVPDAKIRQVLYSMNKWYFLSVDNAVIAHFEEIMTNE